MKIIYYLTKGINKVLYYDNEKIEMQEIIDAILESRFYIEYVDRKKKYGSFNQRYDKYLNYKNLSYMKYIVPKEKQRIFRDIVENNPQVYVNVDEIYNRYLKNQNNIDDYSLIEEESENIKIYPYLDKDDNLKTVTVFESDKKAEEIIETEDTYLSILSSKHRERLVDSDLLHLDREFLNKNHTTIYLPTFLTKSKDEYLENIIYISIYDCGIINIKLLLVDKRKGSLLHYNDLSLGDESYARVEILKSKLKYEARDFFDKTIFSDLTIWDIMSKYVDILKKILNWANLEEDISTTQLEFHIIKENNRLTNKEIAKLLLNSNTNYIDSLKEENVKEIKEKNIVLDMKNVQCYSNNIALVQNIEEDAFKLPTDNKDIDEYIYPLVILTNILENSRIYELAIVQKFYYYNLYNQLKFIKKNNLNIEQFEQKMLGKEEFETNYSENTIFQEKTTYREFYKKVLNNLFIEINYKDKVKKEEKRIKDMIDEKEVTFEKNNNLIINSITVVSSVITLFFSMTSLPNIIEIIGRGFVRQMNIDIINNIGTYLINKSIIISLIITVSVIGIEIYTINKYFKSNKYN